MFKRGAGVEITDEARNMNIDMLALHVQLRGQRLGRTDEYRAVERLLNGYFDDGADAATLGVKTANTLKLTDAWYAAQYMQDKFGFTPKVAVMNLKTAEMWASQKEDSGNLIFLQEVATAICRTSLMQPRSYQIKCRITELCWLIPTMRL